MLLSRRNVRTPIKPSTMIGRGSGEITRWRVTCRLFQRRKTTRWKVDKGRRIMKWQSRCSHRSVQVSGAGSLKTRNTIWSRNKRNKEKKIKKKRNEYVHTNIILLCGCWGSDKLAAPYQSSPSKVWASRGMSGMC